MVAVDEIRRWLDAVPDPEIPVISVTDLGIVRAVAWEEGELVVTITPTYSGCPAMAVISEDIRLMLVAHGIGNVRIQTRLSPAWTTDWLSAKGRANLRQFGIAPPGKKTIGITEIGRTKRAEPVVACPHCGSVSTRLTSQFGSTPCKALYRCAACLEPFDYFKPH